MITPVSSPASHMTAATIAAEQQHGVTIRITPNEGNTTSGDRSGNSATVSVTTPSREFSAEIGRGQAVDAVEHRLTRGVVNQALGSGGDPGGKAVATAIAEQGGEGSVAAIGVARHQQALFNTYVDSARSFDDKGSSSNSDSGQGTSSNSQGVALYNKAVDSYIKQTLLFSAIDGIDKSERPEGSGPVATPFSAIV